MHLWSLRIALILVIASVAYNAGAVWSWYGMNRRQATLASATLPTSAEGVVDPSPEMTPRDVVRLQVESLGRCMHSGQALKQVYAFASPDNKEVTGPLDRFARMLLSPTFKSLVEQRHAVVGTPAIHDDVAAVTVTLLDAQDRIRVYRFYLSKQSTAPHKDCWMTYGVTTDDQAPGAADSLHPSYSI